MKKPINLEKSDVHIWQINLNESQLQLHKAFSVLSEKEKTRAQRFVKEEHRLRFIAAHVGLREILSYYVGVPPQEIDFYQNAHGKPYLRQDSTIQFNMSDSHELALYAVTLQQEVGVDIEWMRPNVDIKGIARRFFSPAEREALLALPEDRQLEAFYRCWTRKEAYIKVIGQGLSFPLDGFEVGLEPEGMQNLLSVKEDIQAARRWALGSLPAPGGYAAALAVEGSVGPIHYFES